MIQLFLISKIESCFKKNDYYVSYMQIIFTIQILLILTIIVLLSKIKVIV